MSRVRRLIALAAVVLAITLTACEWEGETVTVENNSTEVVVVFEDDSPIELVHPKVSQQFSILRFDGTLTYEIQSFATRRVLAMRSFTWQEISDENGITITIP